MKLDPSVEEELRYHRERLVQPERERWPRRPAPAKLLCSTFWLGGPGSLTFDQLRAYVDDVARANPGVLKRYQRIEAPALTWIEPETFRLLRASGALRLPAGRIRFQAPDGTEREDWSAAEALLTRARAAKPKERGARILAAARVACKARDVAAAAEAPAFYSFRERAGEAKVYVRTPAGDEPIGRGAAYARGTGTVNGETRPVIHAVPPYQGAMGQTRATYRVWIP